MGSELTVKLEVQIVFRKFLNIAFYCFIVLISLKVMPLNIM